MGGKKRGRCFVRSAREDYHGDRASRASTADENGVRVEEHLGRVQRAGAVK